VAPHVEEEDSYSEHSDDGEELKEAYKTLYVEFEKLREGRKQHIHDLNSLQTEKSSLLRKIQELEEKLLETQLQLERVTDEKLTHMLSIQKSPTNKTGLGYVAPAFDSPSTSKTVFVKPTVPELLPVVEEKGKEKIFGDVSGTQKPPIIRKSLICHHCGLSGHVQPQCSLLKAQKAKVKKEVPRQANYGTRPLTQYQAPWHQIIIKLHGVKRPGVRLLNIKPHGIMLHCTRLLSSNLYLPIMVANPRTNPSTLKGHKKEEDDLYYREPPIWMQSMMEWMGQQIKSCQQPPTGRQAWVRKNEDIHPMRGNRLT